jgi:hypothetical protein
MAPRRTPRQVLLDGMAEVRDFMPEVVRMAEEDYGGRTMHVHVVTLPNGRSITPTSVPGWPDLTMWFPGSPMPGLHVAELKAHNGRLKPGQADLFATLEAAGIPVPIWEPRDLDEAIPEALSFWSCRPRRPVTFTPRRRRPRRAV